jgi:gliding motility-associated lipoprotein GldD
MNKLWILLALIALIGCQNDYTPKPNGFARIDFPKKEIIKSNLNCPFEFKIPKYLNVINKKEHCWLDLYFEDFDANIHISYKKINNNIDKYIEQSRDLAYKHSRVAEAIKEQAFVNDSLNVYGLVYTYEGATASGIQFYLTDSTNHFVRAALYFNTAQNDSIIPINNFVTDDVYRIIESWKWK